MWRLGGANGPVEDAKVKRAREIYKESGRESEGQAHISRAFNCKSRHCILGRSQGGRQMYGFCIGFIDVFGKPMSPNYPFSFPHAFCCVLAPPDGLKQCQIVLFRKRIPGGT